MVGGAEAVALARQGERIRKSRHRKVWTDTFPLLVDLDGEEAEHEAPRAGVRDAEVRLAGLKVSTAGAPVEEGMGGKQGLEW